MKWQATLAATATKNEKMEIGFQNLKGKSTISYMTEIAVVDYTKAT